MLSLLLQMLFYAAHASLRLAVLLAIAISQFLVAIVHALWRWYRKSRAQGPDPLPPASPPAVVAGLPLRTIPAPWEPPQAVIRSRPAIADRSRLGGRRARVRR